MTKDEFKNKAIEIIDNEEFGCYGDYLFEYNCLDEIKVAQADVVGYLERSMPLMDFIDELYESIWGE